MWREYLCKHVFRYTDHHVSVRLDGGVGTTLSPNSHVAHWDWGPSNIQETASFFSFLPLSLVDLPSSNS